MLSLLAEPVRELRAREYPRTATCDDSISIPQGWRLRSGRSVGSGPGRESLRTVVVFILPELVAVQQRRWYDSVQKMLRHESFRAEG